MDSLGITCQSKVSPEQGTEGIDGRICGCEGLEFSSEPGENLKMWNVVSLGVGRSPALTFKVYSGNSAKVAPSGPVMNRVRSHAEGSR